MLLLSFLAFSLFVVSDASSLSDISDTGIESRAAADTEPCVPAIGPVGQLQIANNYIAPDGYNRSSVLANGIFPGPLIRGYKGDQFSIKVSNGLTDDTMNVETSIHFHGMFQRKSNWADGTSSITQCPVGQQETLVQTFTPTGQTGTYWYHSHYVSQRCDGLQGPLVIYDPEDPLAYLYDVDDENTVITLSDWYHIRSTKLDLLTTRVIANSTLINGKGRYAGGPSTPLSVINVKHGTRYRFRVIAMSCDPYFNFTIDGHRMTIIEVDGIEVNPVDVDLIPIHAGQRYSVVVTADQPVGNYWIRALVNLPNATFDGGQNMAIFRYEGAADEDPTSDAGPYELSFDEGNLHPLINPGAPGIPEIGKADVNLVLAPTSNSDDQFALNNVSFVNPSVPVLLQILSGARKATELLPKGSVYPLPLNKVIEISFPDPVAAAGAPHPVHLHGHAFDVVRIAGTNTTNFINPVRRDVVSIGNSSTDNVTIRFVTDNPGPWFLHCHIDWHLNHGFGVVMAEAPNETAYEESAVIPPDWTQLCKNQG